MRTRRLQLGLFVALMCSALVSLASAQNSPATEQPADFTRDVFSKEVSAAVDAYNHDDFALAREHFARAHELRPSARTWRGLGTTAFELKLYEDAVRELTFALEDARNPLSPSLREETALTLRVARRHLEEDREREADRPREAAEAAPDREAAAPAQPPQPQPQPAQAATAADDANSLPSLRVGAIVMASAGLIAVAVGVGFGLESISKGQERDGLCPAAQRLACSTAARRAADDAVSAGDLSTIAWVAGGVLVAGGVVLWLAGGSAPEPSQTQVSVGLASLRISGAF
jgi:tetratricopeptide (TPR) repeat protein